MLRAFSSTTLYSSRSFETSSTDITDVEFFLIVTGVEPPGLSISAINVYAMRTLTRLGVSPAQSESPQETQSEQHER